MVTGYIGVNMITLEEILQLVDNNMIWVETSPDGLTSVDKSNEKLKELVIYFNSLLVDCQNRITELENQ